LVSILRYLQVKKVNEWLLYDFVSLHSPCIFKFTIFSEVKLQENTTIIVKLHMFYDVAYAFLLSINFLCSDIVGICL
jgi:hypothetical protein